MAEFRMPSLGADMTEGTLLEWLVQPGDAVHRGDIIAVVDTSKSAIDIEVFEDGTVSELLVEPGTTVSVGTPMALLATHGATTVPRGPERPDEPATTAVDVTAPAVPSPPAPPRPGSPALHRPASPLARRKAAEVGVDLASVEGSGPGGAVTMDDVLRAAGGPGPAIASPPTAPTRDPAPTRDSAPTATSHPEAMRAAIAALMARSKREIPHYYLQTTIDLDAALTWLERANAERPVARRILPAALLLKATAVAAREVPEVNGFFVDGMFRAAEHVHLGVAVALRGGGLIAPALHDVDLLSLDEVMAGLKDVGARARGGRLRSSEMSDPTLTVTNLGEQGVDLVHGVIYPPQVALVGFGRIHEQPWAVERMLTVRRVTVATLAADHRVTDGHRGGLFLTAIDAALQKPETL